ncbi:unnamed protein product [Dovyalis caffra]|uniref:PGG domain-containing protein n=1 Tax=Dovyalis caffra TaxID=77055 RepID=A0AAV1RJU4_9ROSI|nr:unnamed protein product [Dovyalis caffra]
MPEVIRGRTEFPAVEQEQQEISSALSLGLGDRPPTLARLIGPIENDVKLLTSILSKAIPWEIVEKAGKHIGWPPADRIRKDKHRHESALKLAEQLIGKNSKNWWQPIEVESTKGNMKTGFKKGNPGRSERQGDAQGGRGDPGEGRGRRGGEGKGGQGVEAQEAVDLGKGREVGGGGQGQGADPGKCGGGGEVENNENVQPKIEENRRHENPPPNPFLIATTNGIVEIVNEIQRKFPQGIELVYVQPKIEENRRKSPPNPLFIATSNGIIEIVNEILEKYPHGIELVDKMGLNILHVAVMHRQRKIFRLIKEKKIIMSRLSSMIDNNGYTLLHQVAHMKHYRGGTKPGPALQLQEEIKWFKRVLKVVPPYHALQREKEHNMTPNELFEASHKIQLKMAQEWIEKTSQSCSAVAVLVATVVFAAAYTIPGGSDDRGFPIFLRDRFFLAFTVLDAIALASSLTSVVMFLSILTTPFECEKFYHDIPRRLISGFTLLFFSVMTTMLAFASTLFLVIRLKKRWTTVSKLEDYLQVLMAQEMKPTSCPLQDSSADSSEQK